MLNTNCIFVSFFFSQYSSYLHLNSFKLRPNYCLTLMYKNLTLPNKIQCFLNLNVINTILMCNLMQFQHLSVANLRLQRNQPKRFVLQKPAETQTSPTSSFYLSPQNQISNNPQPLVNFKSSSSQTTFLDRNIVDNLTLQLLRSPKESLILTKESFDEVEESCAGTITTAAPSSIGAGQTERLRHESGQIKMSTTPYMKNITASWSCSGASACGGSSTTTKRASSISGNLPEGIFLKIQLIMQYKQTE